MRGPTAQGIDDSATARATEGVRAAPSLLAALRRGPDVLAAATEDDPARAHQVLTALIHDPSDQLLAAIATRALGAVRSEAASLTLAQVVELGPLRLRDHATWALGLGPVVPTAFETLTASVVAGGFRGMLAQWTLEQWAVADPEAVAAALVAELAECVTASGRAALVETLGLVPGGVVTPLLCDLAADDAQADPVRAAAVAGLGDRIAHPAQDLAGQATDVRLRLRTLAPLAAEGGPLAAVATLAFDDLTALAGRDDAAVPVGPDDGLTVAQLFLHADVDGELSHAGQGDTGGIATLLVHLGDALLQAEPPIERVLTISRGRAADARIGLDQAAGPGHHYLSIPLWGPAVPAALAWPLRVAARRGIRRILASVGRVDVLHLRMGDVASMVAAAAAADLGVPVVFTLAPDPNALVASREAAGKLGRADFGAADGVEHLVFREQLLRDLEASADHLVLFPRPSLADDMISLMGLDMEAARGRVSVVAEGISLAAIDLAGAAEGEPGGAEAAAALAQLDALLSELPVSRRSLPIAVSVGRLNRVKGMATLVEAWARDPDLQQRCNLLVVGGDLADPTGDEQEQLALIRSVVARGLESEHGLLLPGYRPNATVATWLTAVRHGRPGLAAPGGIYVSASLKEEFGIAILEAMATGLTVVAPATGGPATYVDNGVTGMVVNTGSRTALAAGINAALDLAGSPGADERSALAREMVRDRFGIDTMAGALAEVYHRVSGVAASSLDGVAGSAAAGSAAAGSQAGVSSLARSPAQVAS